MISGKVCSLRFALRVYNAASNWPCSKKVSLRRMIKALLLLVLLLLNIVVVLVGLRPDALEPEIKSFSLSLPFFSPA
jgi:hypothetical protein